MISGFAPADSKKALTAVDTAVSEVEGAECYDPYLRISQAFVLKNSSICGLNSKWL